MSLQKTLRKRWQGLSLSMNNNGIAIIPGAVHLNRNGDVDFPFRQQSSFAYMTEFHEPDAIFVLIAGENPQALLFCNPTDPQREQWTGKRIGVDGAKEKFGFSKVYPLAKAPKILQELITGQNVIALPFERMTEIAGVSITDFLQTRRGKRDKSVKGILNVDQLVGELRLLKEPSELKLMTHAAILSANAHNHMMSICKPGMFEYMLEAEFSYKTRMHGAARLHAYPPIVASGENTCILHYHENSRKIRESDLVLIDAGCEYDGYASDVTRTFPAGKKFTKEQAHVYDLVLQVQKVAIDMVSPATCAADIELNVTELITEGLMSLGIIDKNSTRAQAEKLCKKFYPHSVGHWLGRDVHDTGDYERQVKNNIKLRKRPFEAGMVITIEPGIYIQSGTPHVDKKWWGIGVRIEDDVVVTTDGKIIISKAAAKEREEIEALRALA